MLIPAVISLIISTIFLNLSLVLPGAILLPGKIEPIKVGRVMGVSEAVGTQSVAVEQGGNFGREMLRVIEEVKAMPLTQFGLSGQKLPESQNKPIEPPQVHFYLPAENGAIFDCQEDRLYFAKRPDRQWPIASISKLFTAYTFLDYNPGWETIYQIKASDKREGGKIYLFTGDKVKIKDLFYFSLVGSDNTATAALVNSTGLSEEEFVKKINLKIGELGLASTKLVDPVGLSDGNVSTAREVAKFAEIALANPEISRASLTKKYEFTTEQGRKKSISSTNELLSNFPQDSVDILGGKTGFINSSGYCLVSQFKNQEGKSIITVVLGADSDSNRFSLTKELVNLYYGRPQ